MKKRIKQIRYYGEGSPLNEPKTLNNQMLINGGAFNNFTPITKLGIQTLPGVKFYLNNSNESIVVNNTGIFELDLEDQVQITALRFYYDSLRLISEANLVEDNNTNKGLIIDLVYESEE